MNLPEKLQEAIEKEAARFRLHDVLEARETLTDRYRQRHPHQQTFMTTEAQRCAYIAARMPATYAVIHRVLTEVRSRSPENTIRSLLDLGAGPGSVMWAACDIFPDIVQATLAEKDADLASLGKRLATHSESIPVRNASWLLQDLEKPTDFTRHDLITLSYSVGELSTSIVQPLIEACWNSTDQFLVVIEPGTPAGFERIRSIRSQLIALGAHLVAPCPHALACPMTEGDWCHFSQRVDRSSLHRRIKTGSLGYEDEKFSYIAVSKTPCALPQSRILRHPLKRSGHVILTLCTKDGIQQTNVSKKTPEFYKQVRKLEWGDSC